MGKHFKCLLGVGGKWYASVCVHVCGVGGGGGGEVKSLKLNIDGKRNHFISFYILPGISSLTPAALHQQHILGAIGLLLIPHCRC